MFGTSATWNIIADSGITQYFITDRNLIQDYYYNYSEYQTESRRILPSYEKDTLLFALDNDFFKLANVWYASNLGFKLISTIELGEKRVKRWLWTTDQLSQILHDGGILRYVDSIDGQYVFRLEDNSEPPAIVDSADTKKVGKMADIKP